MKSYDNEGSQLEVSHLAPIEGQLIQALPDFLRQQRWFADKHRTITAVDLAELTALQQDDATILLTIADIQFEDGLTSRYFVPLLITPQARQQSSLLCTAAFGDRKIGILDAIAEPEFHRWLLAAIRNGLDLDTSRGRIECSAEFRSSRITAGLIARVAKVEQSNSSILFGDSLIAKVYRRLTVGTNPDVEVGKFLTRQTAFTESPKLVGHVQYLGQHGPSTLVMVQEQLRDPVDSWSHLLDALRRRDWLSAAVGGPLGRATARLHVAMASGQADDDFAAVDANQTDIDSWKSGMRLAIDQVSGALTSRLEQLDSLTSSHARSVIAMLPELGRRADGFEKLEGLPLIRVHGDYHLGQVLRLPDGKLSIVDFEGEPQRPIHERRMKTSPLKDAAGMLRSFSYARGAAMVAADENMHTPLLTWEREQRQQFIAAYSTLITESGLRLIPEDPQAFDAAIAAWEIDKALYEVLYELSSRPDWLWLPLSSLVRIA